MKHLPLIFLALPAQAETRDISGSLVTLQPTDHPGAVAEIEFENNAVNGPADNSTFTLTLNEMEVRVEYTWNAEGGQNDRITVEPPEGFVAVPRTLDVTEHTTGVVHLFSAGPSS